MDCSLGPPGSSVPGILQAKILEWAAILFCRGSSQPRDRTWTWASYFVWRFFTIWATREAPDCKANMYFKKLIYRRYFACCTCQEFCCYETGKYFLKTNDLQNKFCKQQVNKILVNTEEILISIRKRLQLQSLLEILFHLLLLPIIKASHPFLYVKVFLVNLMITIAFVS